MAASKTKTSAAVKNRYRDKKYDRVEFVVPAGQKSEIAAAAKAAGQSTNAYIVQAIDARMQTEQDSRGAPQP